MPEKYFENDPNVRITEFGHPSLQPKDHTGPRVTVPIYNCVKCAFNTEVPRKMVEHIAEGTHVYGDIDGGKTL